MVAAMTNIHQCCGAPATRRMMRISRLPGVGITDASAMPSRTSPIGPSCRSFTHTLLAMISPAVTLVPIELEAISRAGVADFELSREAQLWYVRQKLQFGSQLKE